MWLAALVATLILVLLAVVVAFNVARGKPPLGGEAEDDPTTSPSVSRSAAPPGLAPYEGVVASDFDPQGDPPEENPEEAPLAVDGDPATSWHSMTYSQQLGPGGLKTGVGLTLDLGASGEVASSS